MPSLLFVPIILFVYHECTWVYIYTYYLQIADLCMVAEPDALLHNELDGYET